MTRLRTATERGTVDRTTADLAAAFEYLQGCACAAAGRLQVRRGPGDLVPLADLGALEERCCSRIPSTCPYQEGVRLAFQADLIA